MKNQDLYSSKDKRKIKCLLLLQFLFGTLRVKKNLESKGLERNRMDKNGYKFFPEPGVVLLQGIICSLSGRKFYPVKVSSQITSGGALSLPVCYIRIHFNIFHNSEG